MIHIYKNKKNQTKTKEFVMNKSIFKIGLKRFQSVFAMLFIVPLVFSLSSLAVYAATFTDFNIVPDDTSTSATDVRYLIKADAVTAATEDGVRVTFPAGFNVDSTASNILVSNGLDTTIIDGSANQTGDGASVAIGTDGFPVLSYDGNNGAGAGGAYVLKCGNTDCTAGNTITNIHSGYSYDTAIAIGSDGFPVVVHTEHSPSKLVVFVKCGNAACSSGNTTTTIASDATNAMWQVAVAIGADDIPVVSYSQSTTSLYVVKCGNAACSSGNTTSTIEALGVYPSLKIGADDNPIISYIVSGDLKVAHCGNDSCSSGNTLTTVDNTTTVDENTALEVGTDGFARIAYFDDPNGRVKFAECSNTNCSSNTISVVDDPAVGKAGKFVSIALDGSDNPVLAYQRGLANDSGGRLDYAYYVGTGGTGCTGSTAWSCTSLYSPGGKHSSMVIGDDGYPFIVFRNDNTYPEAYLTSINCESMSCNALDALQNRDAGCDNIWPGIGSAATGVAGQIVDVASSNLTVGQTYCFQIAQGIDNPSSSGDYNVHAATRASSSDVDSDTKAVSIGVVDSTPVPNQTCPGSVQARFTAGDLGLVQTGTYTQAILDGATYDFAWSAVMNGDAVNAWNVFGGAVTLTKPDLSTITQSSARGEEIALPPATGNYKIEARALNGDLCDMAYITVVGDEIVTYPTSVATPSQTVIPIEDKGKYNQIIEKSNGYPVIKYLSYEPEVYVNFALCQNATCTSMIQTFNPGNYGITAIRPSGDGSPGYYGYLYVNASDYPIYVSPDSRFSPGTLTSLVSSDANYSDATLTKLFSPVGGEAILGVTGVKRASGNPLIFFHVDTSGADRLDMFDCSNANCTAGTRSTLDAAAGEKPTATKLVDGKPVISYYDSANEALKLLICGDVDCSAGNSIQTLHSSGPYGEFSALIIRADGTPGVAYSSPTGLLFYDCDDTTCSTGTSYSVHDEDNGKMTENISGSIITLDADDNPLILNKKARGSDEGSVSLYQCYNPECSEGRFKTVYDSNNREGLYASILRKSNGSFIIPFRDETQSDGPGIFVGTPVGDSSITGVGGGMEVKQESRQDGTTTTADTGSDPETDNFTTAQVDLRLQTTGDVPLADVVTDFNTDGDLDWSSVTSGTDSTKTFVHNLTSADGTASSYTLYVPKPTTSNAVRVCPGATSLVSVDSGCANEIIYDVRNSNVSVVNIGGSDYWKITGMTSTGGESITTTQGVVDPTDKCVNSDMTITFEPETALQTGWQVVLSIPNNYPAGFDDFGTLDDGAVTVTGDNITSTTETFATAGSAPDIMYYITSTLTVTGSQSNTITMVIGDGATKQLQNPCYAGTYGVGIATFETDGTPHEFGMAYVLIDDSDAIVTALVASQCTLYWTDDQIDLGLLLINTQVYGEHQVVLDCNAVDGVDFLVSDGASGLTNGLGSDVDDVSYTDAGSNNSYLNDSLQQIETGEEFGINLNTANCTSGTLAITDGGAGGFTSVNSFAGLQSTDTLAAQTTTQVDTCAFNTRYAASIDANTIAGYYTDTVTYTLQARF